jgi:hypothetical protein
VMPAVALASLAIGWAAAPARRSGRRSRPGADRGRCPPAARDASAAHRQVPRPAGSAFASCGPTASCGRPRPPCSEKGDAALFENAGRDRESLTR